MALHTSVSSPLFLLILAVIIHPSYGAANHLNDESPVEAVCRHTSSHEYCVGNMVPGAPLTAEGIASTALGWAQIRALEVGTIISSLLKDSASGVHTNHRYQLRLQKCWDLNMKAMADLWSANGSFYSKNIKAMVKYLYGAAHDTKRCQVLINGHNLTVLAAKNSDIIKLSEICIVSTKFF
ncbi:hypothetical protein F3Y22_tig00110053pilonHSYRG00021 [Hibiscus syriacus]|uniref:Pectinesterase inhibitor domain-containing protein n=1 Tax=Hibiscus syriacus TaxID=106335 RepID=A0A6A3BJW2_HIBSY|nr:hypothetical protein F3Y22_tig00110053pilonHSYRG00021 [Hibiscus syriacus]